MNMDILFLSSCSLFFIFLFFSEDQIISTWQGGKFRNNQNSENLDGGAQKKKGKLHNSAY